MAIARMSPLWICPSTDGSVEFEMSMRPAISSCTRGAAPRNGTCVILIPVRTINSSVERCEPEPTPVEP